MLFVYPPPPPPGQIPIGVENGRSCYELYVLVQVHVLFCTELAYFKGN